MTTLSVQLVRAVKSLGRTEERVQMSIVPPQMLIDCKGILFFKKLLRGQQKDAQGFFVQRGADNKWSQPVAVSFHKGDVYWGNTPEVAESDLVFLIQDDKLVETLRAFGKIGFQLDSANTMKKGVCVENNEASFIRFATVLSERPDLMSGAAFSYGLVNGHFFPVHVENPRFEFRDSSNAKFYQGGRNLDATTILTSGTIITDPIKADLVRQLNFALNRHFDLSRRFPDYYPADSVAAEPSSRPAALQSPQPQVASPSLASPDPANFQGESYQTGGSGRLWSDSTTSEGESSGFQGYKPRGSADFGGLYGSGRQSMDYGSSPSAPLSYSSAGWGGSAPSKQAGENPMPRRSSGLYGQPPLQGSDQGLYAAPTAQRSSDLSQQMHKMNIQPRTSDLRPAAPQAPVPQRAAPPPPAAAPKMEVQQRVRTNSFDFA